MIWIEILKHWVVFSFEPSLNKIHRESQEHFLFDPWIFSILRLSLTSWATTLASTTTSARVRPTSATTPRATAAPTSAASWTTPWPAIRTPAPGAAAALKTSPLSWTRTQAAWLPSPPPPSRRPMILAKLPWNASSGDLSHIWTESTIFDWMVNVY